MNLMGMFDDIRQDIRSSEELAEEAQLKADTRRAMDTISRQMFRGTAKADEEAELIKHIKQQQAELEEQQEANVDWKRVFEEGIPWREAIRQSK